MLKTLVRLLAVGLLAGCGTVTSERYQASADVAQPERTAAAEEGRPVTFEDDVLPLLSSRTTGRVYKCVHCHPDYEDAKNLIKPGAVDDIIESVRDGSMPRGGDQMSEADIKIIRRWAKEGFAIN